VKIELDLYQKIRHLHEHEEMSQIISGHNENYCFGQSCCPDRPHHFTQRGDPAKEGVKRALEHKQASSD